MVDTIPRSSAGAHTAFTLEYLEIALQLSDHLDQRRLCEASWSLPVVEARISSPSMKTMFPPRLSIYLDSAPLTLSKPFALNTYSRSSLTRPSRSKFVLYGGSLGVLNSTNYDIRAGWCPPPL